MSTSNQTISSDSKAFYLNIVAFVLAIATGGPIFIYLIQQFISSGSEAELYKLIVYCIFFIFYLGMPALGAYFSKKNLKKAGYFLGGIAVFNVVLLLLFVAAFWGAGVFSS